jgi:hypothetical protein
LGSLTLDIDDVWLLFRMGMGNIELPAPLPTHARPGRYLDLIFSSKIQNGTSLGTLVGFASR